MIYYRDDIHTAISVNIILTETGTAQCDLTVGHVLKIGPRLAEVFNGDYSMYAGTWLAR